MIQTLLFVAGLGTTFVLMGLGAGALGMVLDTRTFAFAAGWLVLLLGLYQTGFIRIPLLEREVRMESKSTGGLAGSWLLGFTFSFGWTPCVGPILASVLLLSAQGGHAFTGAFLMLIYTLGLALPFLLLSVFTDSLLGFFRGLSRFMPRIQVAGGILIVLVGIWMIGTNWPTSASTAEEQTPVATGNDVRYAERDFTLNDLDGNAVTLSDFNGKPVYIKFWASWCSICLANMDEFIAYVDKSTTSGDVVVLSIVAPGTSRELSSDKFREWFREQGYDFPVLLDEGGRITSQYGVRGFPTASFITGDGRIAFQSPGHMSNEDIDYIWEEIQRILDEEAEAG